MKCTISYTDEFGNPSLLHPELEAVYGPQAAIGLFHKVAAAKTAGVFGSRKLRPNGEPTLAQVQELMKAGQLDPPTAAMVNADKLDELQEQVSLLIPKLEARLARYKVARKGGTGLDISAEKTDELAALVNKLKDEELTESYIALIQYADKQLSDYHSFLKDKFNAAEAVKSGGANQHPAALEEIATQLKSFAGVLAPDFARKDTMLKSILTGGYDEKGLYRLREEVQELVEQKTEDYLTAIVGELANRENLSEEQIRQHLAGGKDITLITRALGGLADSSNKLLASAFTLVAKARLEAEQRAAEFNEEVIERVAALKKAGIANFGYMLELDKAGKTTGRYVQRVGQSYYELRRKLYTAVKELGDYVLGSNLSSEDKAKNIKIWQAKQNKVAFDRAENIDEDGKVNDGEHHAYTPEFKAIRSQYEELRQDGNFWSWQRKADLGFGSAAEDEKQYKRYLAKYYGPEVAVNSMVKEKGVPTGELVTRMMRFTNRDTTTAIREEKHRDPQYQKMLDDTSATGKLRLGWYNFFIDNLHTFANKLSAEDRDHLMRGELPAIKAKVLSSFNSKQKGFLDWAGHAVANPLEALKGLAPAARAGELSVRTKEDGTLEHDVLTMFTGRFKDEKKISRITEKLDKLDKNAADYAEQERKLKNSLTIEQNRTEASGAETDLGRVLMMFGAMAENYEALKEQEGTLNLMKHAISNREYYLEKDGELILKDGKPVVKEGYSSKTEAQFKDWLEQNFYQDLNLEQSEFAQWAKNFQRYTSLTFQGLNFSAALRNSLVGNLNNRVVAAGKQFGWDKKIATKALAFVSSDIANIAADRMADMLNGDSYVMKPRKSIVDALMSHYNFLQHNTGFDEFKTGGKLDYLYIGSAAGEYHIQSQTAIAKMLATELTGKDGKKSNMLAVHTLQNGKLSIDPNYAEAVKALQTRLVLDVRNINKRIHGNYAEDDKVALGKEWAGSLVLQFKKWMYTGFKARWGRRQFDEGTGIDQLGYYRSLRTLFSSMRELGVKAEAYHKLSELDKANLRMVLQEAKYVALSVGLLMLAEGLKPDPDDEDKHLLYLATNLMERTLDGTRGEILGYSNPMDLYNNVKSPVAGLGSVRDIAVFTKNLVDVPVYGLTGQADKLDYQTGVLKGQSKLLKSTYDLIPALRMKRTLDQLETTGTMWIK